MISGKHIIWAINIAVKTTYKGEEVEEKADLGSEEVVYVDVDLKPGEYKLYELKITDEEWINKLEKSQSDYENGVTEKILYSTHMGMYKIKE